MLKMSERPFMKAVGLYRYLPIDHPESLLDVQMEKPVPGGRDILVKVKAISVNPIDTKVRSPKDKVESEPKILGWDAAGIVEQVGPECTLFKPGDEVYYAGSVTRQGSYSEFQLVDERIVGRKPEKLDFPEAASLPLTTITAWESLFERMGISMKSEDNRNKSILIIGAAGGVGSIAVQLAVMAGLTVIGTASRPESAQWAKDCGAEHIINHFEPLVPQLQKLGYENVNYIFCLHSTKQYWADMAEAIAPQGKICALVDSDEPVNITLLKAKSATFVWEFMFTRPMFQTEDMEEQGNLLNRMADLIDEGSIRTAVTEKLAPINAANLRKAHTMLETGRTIGKIVLEDF